VATGAAVLGGGFLIWTGLTPWDTDYYAHTDLVRSAFAMIFVFIASLSVVQIKNHGMTRWSAANAAYLVALAAYVVLTFFGPSLITRNGIRLQVTAQKAIVLATVLNLALQAFGVRRSTQRSAEWQPTVVQPSGSSS
jgi:hypothetical protein